jgi:hypothetical protein
MILNRQTARQKEIFGPIVVLLSITLISYSLAGCAGMSPRTKAALSCGVVGGLVGAAVGAAIDKKNRGRGAALGAAIGLAAGMGACFAIASYQNREVADYQRTSEEVSYQPSNGNKVEISEFSVSPSSVRPGDKISFNAEYYVMTPNPNEDITVTETRTIKAYDSSSGEYNELGSSSNQITMKPGSRRADGVVNINGLTPQGDYIMALSVDYNGNKAETESPLTVTANPVSYNGFEREKFALRVKN